MSTPDTSPKPEHTQKPHNTALTVAAILLVLGGVSIGYGLCQTVNGLTTVPGLLGAGTMCCVVSAMFFKRAAKQT